MKRVQIGSGNAVSNVAAISGESPAGSGVFFDVPDSLPVAPFWLWDGNSSNPQFSYGVGPFRATLDTRIAAAEMMIPLPAVVTPRPEMTGGSVGQEVARFALEDHQHGRLTSTTYATLDGSGRATVTFTRTFANKPGFSITEIDGTNTQPLVCVVESFVPNTPTGPYTGCVVKGYRSQALPAQQQMSVLAILGTVVAGINSLAASLTGFNVFGGSSSGASVSVVAIARSDVSSS